MEKTKKKAVVGANVLISALINPKGLNALVVFNLLRSHSLYAPKVLIEEVRRYLSLIAKKRGASTDVVELLFKELTSKIILMDPPANLLRKALLYVNDETDAPYVATAILAGQSTYILTWNTKDYKTEALRSREGIIVVTPDKFVEDQETSVLNT